jgi:hypothetical protein
MILVTGMTSRLDHVIRSALAASCGAVSTLVLYPTSNSSSATSTMRTAGRLFLGALALCCTARAQLTTIINGSVVTHLAQPNRVITFKPVPVKLS